MTRVGRGLAALAALGVVCLLPGTASASAPVRFTAQVLQSNWYWTKAEASVPVALLPAAPEPSNVPTGDLPVASSDGSGTPSKIPYIGFSLPDAVSPTVSAFTLTLTVDPDATNVTTSTPQLAAALPVRRWLNGPGGQQGTSSAPAVGHLVPGTASADGKSYTFLLPAYAQSWLDDANTGVAIVPAAGYTTPFQLSFLGGHKVTGAMTYLPGTEAAVAPPPGQPSSMPSASAPLAGPQTGSLDPGTSLGGTSNLTPATPVTAPPTAPIVAVPGQGAAVSPPSLAPTGSVAVPRLKSISGLPSFSTALVGLGLLALLGVASLSLGGGLRRTSSTSTSRLSLELARRT